MKNKYHDKIFTLPNLLSFFRIFLIFPMIALYVQEYYVGVLILLVISGLTDIADGIIARKYNMISDFGKALDPIADKTTQLVVLICLIFRFSYMAIPAIFLAIKELCAGITVLISIKKTKAVKGAAWHGKLTTVVIYITMATHLIWYNIPKTPSLIMVGICIGVMLMSFLLYLIRTIKAIRHGSYEN